MPSNHAEIQPTDLSGRLDLLQQYFQDYVVSGRTAPINKKEAAARAFIALLGSAWGIPWISAASSAAVIFPSGLTRDIFEKIFSAGIVATVGFDGLWVMLQIGKDLGSKLPSEKQITQKGSKTRQITTLTASGIFSLFSCISSVYASTQYNSGANQLLGIITLVVNYGYGFYGYQRFLNSNYNNVLMAVHRKFGIHQKEVLEYDAALANQQKFLRKIDRVIAGLAGMDSLNNDVFSSMDLATSGNDGNIAGNQSQNSSYLSAKNLFQLLPTILLSCSSSLVSILLTKAFLEDDIIDSAAFAYTAAILSEIPGFVIGIIGNLDVFGRIYDLIFRSAAQNPNLTTQEYSWSKFILPTLVLLVSLTAPTAAAYISYNTLNSDDVNPGVQWTAVAAMIGARLTFSNFTLNAIARLGLETIYSKTHNTDDDLAQKGRLIEFRNTVATANVNFFKLPPSNPTNANHNNEIDDERTDEHTHLLMPGYGYGDSSDA